MKYKTKKVLEVIEEIDKALELLAPEVQEEMRGGASLVATPINYAQSVLTKTRSFLDREGGA